MPWWVSPIRRRSGCYPSSQTMFTAARIWFLVAWACPTVALIGGGLPPDRLCAAFIAAALSGALICALPVAGFRVARLVTLLLLPVSWLWVGYVSLNGMGPSASDALGMLANTTFVEATTALHLVANTKSVLIGLLQAASLAVSFACGRPYASHRAPPVMASLLLVLMVIAWLPRLMREAPSFLPGRDDVQNFAYGSLLDLADAWVDHRALIGAAGRHGPPRGTPRERRVTGDIDAVFILGETFRFDRPWDLRDAGGAWSALDARFRAGLGAFLPKVCASADSTAASVPMLVSGTSPERPQDAALAPSGLARLAAAGYETAWISNQGEDFFSNERRDLVWVAEGYANQYDDALLPIAAAFLGRGDHRNKALLIHLMDSHAAYQDRYPPAAEPAGLDEERLELLRYRRANDHTATILARIARLLDGLPTPAFAIYVADHGENLLVDHNGLHYHVGARTTARAAYVPSFVFWNRAFLSTADPNARLRSIMAAPSLAHADVYAIWMNFGGLPADLSPTAEPKILGKAKLTDAVGPVPCARLAP